jgi:DNA-binding NarL/FixJ family response regulator
MAHAMTESVFLDAPHSEEGRLSKPRILLADDHPGFPEMVEQLLRPKFEVVGKVVDGQSLFEAAIELKPDVIVMDISMPVLDGITTADRLKESGCASRIVFLTVHSDPDFVRACLATGAFGYVVKSRLNTELVAAIRDALAGRLFISQHVTPLKER